jgi:flagellar hook assembly protein FlgD
VRRLADDTFVPRSDGYLQADWDGRDDDGHKARPGMYVARLESGGRQVTVRVPFLK